MDLAQIPKTDSLLPSRDAQPTFQFGNAPNSRKPPATNSDTSTMLQFLAGTAAIAFPQVGAPAVGVLAAVKVAGSLRRRKLNKAVTAQRLKSESVGAIDAQFNRFIQDVVEPVTLEWSDLKLNLKQKDGTEKPILRGVSGVARPGRCVPVRTGHSPRHADARHTPHVHAILHHHHATSMRNTTPPAPTPHAFCNSGE